jgi:hypothetical protein
VLEQQNRRVQRERPSDPDAYALDRIQITDAPFPRLRPETCLAGQTGRLFADFSRRRFDLERERHRKILHDGHCIDERRPIADDPEAIERRQPVRAVDNIQRRTAEDLDHARIRQAGARHEVHEDFGSGLIEPDQRNPIVDTDRQLLNAQRPQRAVLFTDRSDLDRGGGMRIDGCHDPKRRFTSSTIRLDTLSASISTLAAARLLAMAPYAIIPCTMGGSSPVSTLAPSSAATIVNPIANVPMENTGFRMAAIRL